MRRWALRCACARRNLALNDTLFLAAETDLPAEFQWYFNGVPLPGETNSFLVEPNFNLRLAGTYRPGPATRRGRP